MHNTINNADKTAAAEAVRKDIPLLRGGGVHYLDNAATALMPQVVTDATAGYDNNNRANIGRGLHKFAEVADARYGESRRALARLLNAADDEVIFTSGASAGLNLLAAALGQTLSPADAVVLSIAEHHSNIVPWQIAAKRYGFSLRFAAIDKSGAIDIGDLSRQNADGRARVFSLTNASNVSGAINNIGKMAKAARAHNDNAIIIIDGAQYAPHYPAGLAATLAATLGEDAADFYVFSGHKCYAPNGIGILCGRRAALESLPPVIGGGGAVNSVREDDYDMAAIPRRLEVGTPPITQAIGLAAAMQWAVNIPAAARQNANDLATMARQGLREIKGVRVLFDIGGDDNNNDNDKKGEGFLPIISFTMDNVHPHDCCQLLSAHNVAARGGNMCAEPLMRRVSPNGCVRVSIAPYNNAADITAMLDGVRETAKLLGR